MLTKDNVMTQDGQKRELITIAEAARIYKTTRQAVQRWIKAGLIQGYEQQLPRRLFVDKLEIDRKREIRPLDYADEE